MEVWNKMLKPTTLSAVMEKQEKGVSAAQHFGSVLGTCSCAASFPLSGLAKDTPSSTVGALAQR